MMKYFMLPHSALLDACDARAPGRGVLLPVVLVLTGALMALPAAAAPTVTGNTISWPDDGWYQVQNATDYTSLCEGGRSCEVPDGTYIVINHSSGERFNNVVVGDDGGNNPGTGIAVEGNTILMPDDGWYQVQSAVDYTSLCEGVTSCDVPNGTYIVINHTTGQRFENIQVNGEGGMPPDPYVRSAITVENHVDVLNSVFELFNGSRNGYGDELLALPQFSDPRYNEPPPEVPADQADDQPAEEIDCRYNGSAVFTPIQQGDRNIARGWSMEFDQCQDEHFIGGRRLDGQLLRLSQSFEEAESTRFQISAHNTDMSFHGKVTWLARASRSGNDRSWGLENVFFYSIGPVVGIPFRIENANTRLYTSPPFERSMEGSLTVLDPTIAEQKTLEVTITEKLLQRISASDGNPDEIFNNNVQFESGRLQIVAEDGSSLVLDAGAGVPETADITITQADGQVDVLEQPWSLWSDQLTCAFESSGRGGCL